nr:MAG TPA: hypothetical protein [Caudoviricetes sp.]
MFKTCIIVPRYGKAPDIINHTLDVIGFHVDTIIYETNRVSFYVRYKWYQYYKVCSFKKAVKNYVNNLKYKSAANTFYHLLALQKRASTEQFAKAISRFTKAGFQGNPGNSNEKEMIFRRKLK